MTDYRFTTTGTGGTSLQHAGHNWESWSAYVACDLPSWVDGDMGGLCCHTCKVIHVDTHVTPDGWDGASDAELAPLAVGDRVRRTACPDGTYGTVTRIADYSDAADGYGVAVTVRTDSDGEEWSGTRTAWTLAPVTRHSNGVVTVDTGVQAGATSWEDIKRHALRVAGIDRAESIRWHSDAAGRLLVDIIADTTDAHGTCADCTARHGTATAWRLGNCEHDSAAILVPLTRDQLDIPADTDDDRAPVADIVTLSQLHCEGRAAYRKLTGRESRAIGARGVTHALRAIATPWGGVTIGNRPGSAPADRAAGYAVAIRPHGAEPIRIPTRTTGAEHAETATTSARVRAELESFTTRAPFVGVFRDEVSGTIDIDPVAIVATRREADALGVFCRSTGGAYSYSDGFGYWTPTL